MHTYTHTYTHAYTHTYTDTYANACMHACVDTYIHAQTKKNQKRKRVHTHTHVHTYAGRDEANAHKHTHKLMRTDKATVKENGNDKKMEMMMKENSRVGDRVQRLADRVCVDAKPEPQIPKHKPGI